MAKAGSGEDAGTMPAGWGEVLHPRRGGAPGPPLPDPADAPARVAAALAPCRADIEEVLDTSAEFATPGRAAFEALVGNGPLDALTAGGAAAVAVAAGLTFEAATGPLPAAAFTAMADAWVALRGVPFAAEAAGRCAGLAVDRQYAADRKRSGWHRYELRSVRVDDWWWHEMDWHPLAERVRAHLAVASAADYRAGLAGLAVAESAVTRVRVLRCYLAPTDADRMAEVCRLAAERATDVAPGGLVDMLRAVSSVDHLDHLVPAATTRVLTEPATLASLLDGIGAPLAPRLAQWCERVDVDTDGRARLLEALVAIPTDEAFELLVGRLGRRDGPAAVRAALRRYPVRGMRLLAAAADTDGPGAGRAGMLLRDHAVAHPDLAGAVPARLRPAPPVPTAGADRLPAVLVDPPWTRRAVPTAPVVITDLAVPAGSRLVWRPGERAAWASRPPMGDAQLRFSWAWSPPERQLTWAEVDAEYGEGLGPKGQCVFFMDAPEDYARARLASWRPDNYWAVADGLNAIVARYGLDALPSLLHLAAANPGKALGHFMPYAAPEVAALMAAALVRFKAVQRVAAQWLRRHAAAAAQALTPAALGAAGPERDAAEAALRLLAAGGHRPEVRAAAAGYGGPAAAAVDAMLDAGLAVLPKRVPRLPDWLDPAGLPPVLLRERDAALPAGATAHLCTMLAISEPGSPYAGVGLAAEACDPDSLADFGWAVFERWQLAGAPAAAGWVLPALGLLGDDRTAARLEPLIRAWPGEGGHSWAVAGVDVLAAIGTESALRLLCGIAAIVPYKALRERATEKVGEVAAELSLSPEQLADRLVPDLGLGPDTGPTLSYGPRSFEVRVDEQLVPYAIDPAGLRRKDLPKPAATDDPELAAASRRRFTALRKQARTVAAEQATRLELAMVTCRRWTAAEFGGLLVAHPLLGHLVRRLVWATFDGAVPVAAGRPAGDGSLTGLDGRSIPLDPTAVVGVAHPVHLGAGLAAWARQFDGEGIEQPFPQLHRQAYALTAAELAASTLDRFVGRTVPTGNILGLCQGRWLPGRHEHAWVQTTMELSTPDDLLVVVRLHEGIQFDPEQYWPDQTLTGVRLLDPVADGRPTLPFSELDPVTASEVLRDLTGLPDYVPAETADP